jgi:hypothetical protein
MSGPLEEEGTTSDSPSMFFLLAAGGLWAGFCAIEECDEREKRQANERRSK